jgi:hypothetical protein
MTEERLIGSALVVLALWFSLAVAIALTGPTTGSSAPHGAQPLLPVTHDQVRAEAVVREALRRRHDMGAGRIAS